MKKKIMLALVLLLLGLTDIVDWISFSTREENENLGWTAFKAKYVGQLPAFLEPLYERPFIVTGILILCFGVSGIIFIREKNKIFFALGILSFLMGAWMLFSLM